MRSAYNYLYDGWKGPKSDFNSPKPPNTLPPLPFPPLPAEMSHYPLYPTEFNGEVWPNTTESMTGFDANANLDPQDRRLAEDHTATVIDPSDLSSTIDEKTRIKIALHLEVSPFTYHGRTVKSKAYFLAYSGFGSL